MWNWVACFDSVRRIARDRSASGRTESRIRRNNGRRRAGITMRWDVGRMTVAVCAAVAVMSCNSPSSSDNSASAGGETVTTVSTGGNRIIQEVKKGLGIACRVYGPPSTTGDFSYLISDIGREGVPRPSTSEMRMINRIKKYVRSKSLRFEYVAGREFIVYDAALGPCETAAPGYRVLNSESCNLYYSPTDDFDGAKAVPDCYGTPEPWIVNKTG